jgi:hypothetical protein
VEVVTFRRSIFEREGRATMPAALRTDVQARRMGDVILHGLRPKERD